MSDNLANLAKIGKLKAEAFSQTEFKGLVASARNRLADARNESLSPDGRCDLAYNASHAFALAALRRKNYRSENRTIVFQVDETTAYPRTRPWTNLGWRHLQF